MDTAIVGLIGVIAGAIVTGGFQALRAASARSLNSRTAARLMISPLMDARSSLVAVLKLQDWGREGYDWERLLAPWREHRDPLVRALPTDACLTLTITFAELESLIAVRGSVDLTETAELIRTALRSVDGALCVIWKAGLPAWRRRFGAPPLPFAPALVYGEGVT